MGSFGIDWYIREDLRYSNYWFAADITTVKLQLVNNSLQASSPRRSGGGAGKGRRACNYVSMLIGGDDITNDVITFDTCFTLIGGNLTDQSMWSHKGNWRWNSNSRHVVTRSPSLYRPATRATRRARGWCATNAECRLADWLVNEKNLVVECFNRVPIPKV